MALQRSCAGEHAHAHKDRKHDHKLTIEEMLGRSNRLEKGELPRALLYNPLERRDVVRAILGAD